MQFYKVARTHVGKLLQQENAESLQFLSNNFDRLIQYSQLNNLSAIILAQDPDIAGRDKLSQIIPISENWCDIGSIYQSQNNYDKAEYYYREASYMISSQLPFVEDVYRM